MSTRTPPHQRGIALIIALIAVTALSFLAAGFAYSMKVEMTLARNANSDSDMFWLGRSGVEKARWILAQQLSISCEPYDALDQFWAGGSGSLCSSNSPLAGMTMDVELGGGKGSITITDLERKANINMAGDMMLQQALNLIGVDANEAQTIKASIRDWIDPDNNSVGGAESDYYQGLTPSYFAKNAPIDDLSELLLVKGVTPEVYWGGVSTNHPISAFQGRLGRYGPGANLPAYSIGLVNLFTPISSGRININTASAEVLQLVPPIDENMAARIIEFRTQGEGLAGPMPIGSPGKGVPEALLYAGFNQAAVQQLARYFDVRSKTFEVQVDASIGGRTQRFLAILLRNNPRDVQILSFHPVLPE
jgi:general secretion pathway protein K